MFYSNNLPIGINDIRKDIPDAVIADNIRKIVVRAQAPDFITQNSFGFLQFIYTFSDKT